MEMNEIISALILIALNLLFFAAMDNWYKHCKRKKKGCPIWSCKKFHECPYAEKKHS